MGEATEVTVASGREVTGLLRRWQAGDGEAFDRLLPVVYEELRRLAQGSLRAERREHTLQPTALVHEAYLRLVDHEASHWRDRLQFFAVAAQLMRQVLVDHARGRKAQKRGGGILKVPFEEAEARQPERATDLLELDEALRALEQVDARKSRIIELRFFGGLSLEETAQVIGLSVPAIVKQTRLARAWLFGRLATGPAGATPGRER